MRMSFPRAREVGKVPPFCFQARFPRHGGAQESKIMYQKCAVSPGCTNLRTFVPATQRSYLAVPAG